VKNRIVRGFATVLLILIFTTSSALAQQGGTTTYVYDANGRLYAVISPAGEAAVYEYDAAGNITAIRRLAANELTILSFSPHEGMPGDLVTFLGVGFGGVTTVSFNGASATIVSVTTSKIVATVPAAATTGLVTITTPTGSVTTTEPFTIAGLRITPSFAPIKFGESVQFTAEVFPATLDQTVEWSVDGIPGGNASVGTISAMGLYTAPNTRFTALTIRAVSVADSTRAGEAGVRVSDPNDVQSILAPSVSVRLSRETLGVTALSQQLSVQYRFPSELQTTLSQQVSVHYDNLRGAASALAVPVSVRRGSTTVQSAALANQVSIKYENSLGRYGGPGPYHPPDGIKLRCNKGDSCPVLEGKMFILMRMITSHEGWDRYAPAGRGGNRHVIEIADLWGAYAGAGNGLTTKSLGLAPIPPSVSTVTGPGARLFISRSA